MGDRGDEGAPHGPPDVVRETHISRVILAGDRAYKLLKPVRLPFLDFSAPAQRSDAIQRELELNRRIAPDVYLGTADVVEGGEVVDRMLVMRRLPDDRRLSALVGSPGFAGCLRDVARLVARFHAACPPVRPAPMATRDALVRNWEDNAAVIERSVGIVIDGGEHDEVRSRAQRYLAGRESLLDRRIAAGWVRDGHGDLLADDIFCLDDGPRVIDCLAFDDDYRIGDVLLDIAFLVMDVERLAGWSAARDVMRWYVEFSGEHHPASLAHHYVAYRSHVRAKVACLRHRQSGDEADAALARQHHRITLDHLTRGTVRLIVVGGGPGTGKSVLAGGLADHYGATSLATDEIRKDLTRTPHSEHRFAGPGEGIYDDDTTDATYAEVTREAALLLERGVSVVLDASWTAARHRAAVRRIAGEHHAELVELRCVLDSRAAKERIARRLADPWNPSDATPDLVDHFERGRDPWPEAAAVDTDRPIAAVLDHAVALVDGQ